MIDEAYTHRRSVYDEYINSIEWRRKREDCFDTHGKFCIDCGDNATDVHHLHYDSLGDEDPVNDLHPLCSYCHNHRHETNDYYGVNI